MGLRYLSMVSGMLSRLLGPFGAYEELQGGMGQIPSVAKCELDSTFAAAFKSLIEDVADCSDAEKCASLLTAYNLAAEASVKRTFGFENITSYFEFDVFESCTGFDLLVAVDEDADFTELCVETDEFGFVFNGTHCLKTLQEIEIGDLLKTYQIEDCPFPVAQCLQKFSNFGGRIGTGCKQRSLDGVSNTGGHHGGPGNHSYPDIGAPFSSEEHNATFNSNFSHPEHDHGHDGPQFNGTANMSWTTPFPGHHAHGNGTDDGHGNKTHDDFPQPGNMTDEPEYEHNSNSTSHTENMTKPNNHEHQGAHEIAETTNHGRYLRNMDQPEHQDGRNNSWFPANNSKPEGPDHGGYNGHHNGTLEDGNETMSGPGNHSFSSDDHHHYDHGSSYGNHSWSANASYPEGSVESHGHPLNNDGHGRQLYTLENGVALPSCEVDSKFSLAFLALAREAAECTSFDTCSSLFEMLDLSLAASPHSRNQKTFEEPIEDSYFSFNVLDSCNILDIVLAAEESDAVPEEVVQELCIDNDDLGFVFQGQHCLHPLSTVSVGGILKALGADECPFEATVCMMRFSDVECYF